MAQRVCPVCGAPHAACGAGAAPPRYILDLPTTARRTGMAELALYDVTVRGTVTQMKLTEHDAATLDAKKVGSVKGAEPQPVTRPPYAASVPEPGESLVRSDTKQAPPARNKARGTDPKS